MRFFASLLDYQTLGDNKFSKEIKLFKYKLVLPSINESNSYFINNGKSLIIPLTSIKGLPTNISSSIIYERELEGRFVDFIDFISRMKDYKITLAHVITLVNSGAFDEFGETRNTLRKAAPIVLQYIEETSSQLSLLSKEEEKLLYPVISKYEEDEVIKLEKEIETLGILISGSFLDKYRNDLEKNNIKTIQELPNCYGSVNIGVIMNSIRNIQTKKNENMAILNCFDDTGDIKVVVFTDTYEKFKFKLIQGCGAIINGIYRKDDKGISFIANSIELLKEN